MKIAIVGGGVAGASTALYLGELGLEVTLFEKESSLVNGPPFCHLHAGGNLYREISDQVLIDAPFPKIIFHEERGTPQGMGQFIPSFSDAKVSSKALFGAQQIPREYPVSLADRNVSTR